MEMKENEGGKSEGTQNKIHISPAVKCHNVCSAYHAHRQRNLQ